ncbi:hypothetical protein C6Q12_00640 [Burkholderia multivorans]|nr:hypothetical protein C6Q12_00640 [Burkholderia multivorans]
MSAASRAPVSAARGRLVPIDRRSNADRCARTRCDAMRITRSTSRTCGGRRRDVLSPDTRILRWDNDSVDSTPE